MIVHSSGQATVLSFWSVPNLLGANPQVAEFEIAFRVSD